MTPHSADLFEASDGEDLSIVDGSLRLWRQIDLGEDDQTLLKRLIDETDWREESVTLYGKTWPQPRLTAWHGDLAYRYSGIELQPTPWTPTLQALREKVQVVTGHPFNSVLLNYYRDEGDKMGMHSDDEKSLGPNPVIASLSLGATRNFVLRHKTRKDLDSIRVPLSSGSLLLMGGALQHHWRHGLNAQSRACGARVNLTFRLIHPT